LKLGVILSPSVDAQREAGEAFIISQMHGGAKPSPTITMTAPIRSIACREHQRPRLLADHLMAIVTVLELKPPADNITATVSPEGALCGTHTLTW
jgi:hypothetical protein